jgi:UDP-N-acetylglucosamine diphosphorylase/glucosamine-1-phosphate N-acetyltransferase
MNLTLFEDAGWRDLLPLTWLRACFELRCGVDTLRDKIEGHFDLRVSGLLVREGLERVVAGRMELSGDAPDRAGPLSHGRGSARTSSARSSSLSDARAFEPMLLVNSRALMTDDMEPPPVGTAWTVDGELVAACVAAAETEIGAATFLNADLLAAWLRQRRCVDPPPGIRLLRYPWELVHANPGELRRQLTRGGTHEGHIYDGVHLLDARNIHIASGAVIKPGVVLDAEDGPIQIDHDAVIQPNCVIQGPAYIGRRTLVQPMALIRNDTSIGPVCKVGGEIEASIIAGYANKQHDGFLGHSYVAPWVNLGADTVTSDLKNTYGPIRASLPAAPREAGSGTRASGDAASLESPREPIDTGHMFLGSIIADHVKTGIGTILPTGCVLGAFANVFTRTAVPTFVPSFAWLTSDGLTAFRVDKAIEIARTVMARRKNELSAEEEAWMRSLGGRAR